MKKVLRNIWPWACIMLLWLAFSFPYWGKGRIPFPSTYLVTFFAPWSATYGMPVKNNAMPDVITQIYPWKRLTINSWKQGEMPLWNPYSFSGTSHVGNYQSAVFSPVNALFFVLPEIHAWSIMILLQPILAGLFMFLLLRSLRISREGSVVGSIGFMFSGFMTVWMAYGTLSYAVLFLPLILFGINTFVSGGNKWAAVLFAIGIMLSLLSGHFQMSLYVLIYGASFLIYLFFSSHERKRVFMATLIFFTGVLLAAPQILPAYESYTAAARSSIFGKGEVIPWQYLITIFSPDFYGNPVTRNDWFGHYAEWASFIGVAPLLLAMFALFTKWKERLVRYAALMTAISFSLAFPTPLLDALYALKIPVLSTSSASRIIVLASFSLATLSGIGFDAMKFHWDKRKRRSLLMWSLGSVLFVLGVWMTLIFFRPLPPDKLAVAVRNTYLPSLFAGGVVLVSMLGYLLPKRFLVILPFILIGITGADMYRFAAKWMPFDPIEYMYPNLPVLTTLQSLTKTNHARIFGNIGNESGSPFGLPLIEGYDAVYQQRYGKLITSASTGDMGRAERSVVRLDKGGKHSEEILELLGVQYYLHKKSDGRLPWAYAFWEYPQYERAWEDEHFEILENTKALPRAFLASSYVVATGEQDAIDYLYSPKINKRDTVVLERVPSIEPMQGKGSVTISSYRSNEVLFEVTSESPKLLFLSDSFDTGWRASVGGKETDIYRADYDFRAVAVPSGTHTVRMWYRPMSVSIGFALAGFATLILSGFIVWKRNV